MNALREKVHQAGKIVIIGGGFIGAEFADELSRGPDVDIYLIEVMPKLLLTAFDGEFCDEIARVLDAQRVNIRTSSRVVSIDGSERVESVSLESGEKIPADMVLISVGAKPSSKLAKNAGLKIVENGSIWVDNYMRTDIEDVFAVGDCALKRDFFTRKAAPVWLASTATAEARNAGTNIFGIRVAAAGSRAAQSG